MLNFFKNLFTPKENTKQPKPFRTHELSVFWREHGRPHQIGTKINVVMQSGKTAVFRLTNVERALGVDWSWYDFEFVNYL